MHTASCDPFATLTRCSLFFSPLNAPREKWSDLNPPLWFEWKRLHLVVEREEVCLLASYLVIHPKAAIQVSLSLSTYPMSKPPPPFDPRFIDGRLTRYLDTELELDELMEGTGWLKRLDGWMIDLFWESRDLRDWMLLCFPPSILRHQTLWKIFCLKKTSDKKK